MKVYDDKLMMELKDYDLTKGHLEDAKIVSKHHPATPRKFHLEVMQHDSISGLRHEVEDSPARPAWDEYEAVKRYVPYTDEELAAIAERKKQEEANAKAAEEELKKAQEEYEKQSKEEEARRELLDKIDAQVTYTALQTNTLLPSEE